MVAARPELANETLQVQNGLGPGPGLRCRRRGTGNLSYYPQLASEVPSQAGTGTVIMHTPAQWHTLALPVHCQWHAPPVIVTRIRGAAASGCILHFEPTSSTWPVGWHVGAYMPSYMAAYTDPGM